MNKKGELRTSRKIFLAITFLTVLASFVTGVYTILFDRDRLFAIISFTITFVTLNLAIIQAFPSILDHLRKSLRIVFYIIVVCIFLSLAPLLWFAMQVPVIKIGVSLPFMGGDKQDAIAAFNGIKQALDQETDDEHKIGNYTIQLTPFDDSNLKDAMVQPISVDNGTPVGGSVPFSSITDDGQIAGIIGPFNSGTAVYEIPPTNKANIALISPANTIDCLTDSAFANKDGFACSTKTFGTGTFFRLATVDSIRAEVLANYFWKLNPKSTIVIYNDATNFGKSFGNRFSESWQKKTGVKPMPIKLSNDPQQDLEDLAVNPTVILYAGTGSKGIELHRAMQQLPQFAHTSFAAAATIMSGGFTTHINPATSGDIYAISPVTYVDGSNIGRTFSSLYNKNFVQEPTPYSASAYDATRMLLISIKEAIRFKKPPITSWDFLGNAPAFRQEVLKKLNEVNNNGATYEGATGTFYFTPSGDITDGTLNYEKRLSIFKYNKQTDKWDYVPQEK